MNAKVYSNQELIGEVDLQIGDYYMGGLYGIFITTDYYINHVQPIIWAFNESQSSDFSILENLNLRIEICDGISLDGVGGISIADYPEMFGESIEFTIAGVDVLLIDRLFGIED